MAKSKEKKNKRHYESSSSGSSDSDDSDSYSSSGSDSDDHQIKKKQKVDLTAKKQKKKAAKKAEKKKKNKAKNKISKDDYYSKSTEFRLWLMEEKKKSFDELKTDKSKAYFKKFVKKWNTGRLAKKYYKGIDSADEKASLTKYKWKFAEKYKSGASSFMRNADGSIDTISPFQTPQPKRFSTFGKSSFNDSGSKSVPPDAKFIGPSRPPPMSQLEQENSREEERKRLQKERREFNSYNKMVMEELVPKATGHEAKVQKRQARAYEKKHRRNSPEMDERAVMGGADISQVLEKRRKKQEERKDDLAHKANLKKTEYQMKEQAKMKALLEMAKANKSQNALW